MKESGEADAGVEDLSPEKCRAKAEKRGERKARVEAIQDFFCLKTQELYIAVYNVPVYCFKEINTIF